MNFLQDDINSVSLNQVTSNFKTRTYINQIMILNLYVDSDSQALKKVYCNAVNKHNLSLFEDPFFFNAGFDLFLPENQTFTSGSVNKANFKVKCSAQIINMNHCDSDLSNDSDNRFYTGYYMYPRSSLSKTPLRLANCTGIIDAGYRGPLIGMFDCLSATEYVTDGLTRLLQICAPNLMPIYIRVADSIDDLGPETTRGEGGFGSTG